MSLIVAIMFLYTPVAVFWIKGKNIDFIDQDVRSYFKSIITFLISALCVFPPFLILAHLWQVVVFNQHNFHVAGFSGFWGIAAFQLFIVALPEEFFFRGYFQGAMNSIFKSRWNVFGTKLGWAWIITAAIFAIAHTIVVYRWWQFSIFFPALMFGYLRERTGSITAPILFHASSNLLMVWFTACYL